MSIQSTDDVTTYACSYCGDDRTPATSVGGSFCSIECHRAHRREKRAGEIFELLEKDHRFCATCCAQLKEVDKPAFKTLVVGPSLHDADWGNASDVLVGYQDRTPAAETGEISMDVDDDRESEERPIVEDGVATGTICRCGQTDHRDVEPAIRSSLWTDKILRQLVAAIATLREEDKHDVQYDEGRLFEHGLETGEIRGALEQAVVLDG